VNTHLQSPVGSDPDAIKAQTEQAKQLLRELRNSSVPVVIAGDFNSDAIYGASGPGPDNTGTVAMIQAAGYLDSWAVTNQLPGPTWPLFQQDQFPPSFFFAPASPYERIDLIFSQGLNTISTKRVLAPGPAANRWPYFGSDHAGVVAIFDF
jgi:endonuclease/exonuclease/phosphatase (EEP) superfamily protein YafD